MKNFEGTIVLGADKLEKMMLAIKKARNDDENICQTCILKPQHDTSGWETTCPRLTCVGCKVGDGGKLQQASNLDSVYLNYICILE